MFSAMLCKYSLRTCNVHVLCTHDCIMLIQPLLLYMEHYTYVLNAWHSKNISIRLPNVCVRIGEGRGEGVARKRTVFA